MVSTVPPTPPKVMAALIAERRAGWHGFLRFVGYNCLATASILVILLLVFKVF